MKGTGLRFLVSDGIDEAEKKEQLSVDDGIVNFMLRFLVEEVSAIL